MTVLTKRKKRHARPRCEAMTVAGGRCQMHGNAYRDTGLLAMCVCTVHQQAPAVRHYRERKAA